MKIIAKYSHREGGKYIAEKHFQQYEEVKQVIQAVKASEMKTKISEEKHMYGAALYSPTELNTAFNSELEKRGWEVKPGTRIMLEVNIPETGVTHRGPREMDAIKNRLGLEIQFGKYAFMIYNILSKMTLFAKQGFIDSGIEIVPMLNFAKEMSTGVSYFEQAKADLVYRGESDIDIPTLLLGIDDEERAHPLQKSL